MKCIHNGLIDSDGTVSCDKCDWCPNCEAIQPFNEEICSHCGYVWGVG